MSETDSEQGAIDNDFDEAKLNPTEQLLDSVVGIQTEPIPGGIALDLVTRQPLFVKEQVADSVVEYFEEENFNLLDYKMHPYLPVGPEDAVFKCVFIPRSAEKVHKIKQTYDYPRGRLMAVPVQEAWIDDDD